MPVNRYFMRFSVLFPSAVYPDQGENPTGKSATPAQGKVNPFRRKNQKKPLRP